MPRPSRASNRDSFRSGSLTAFLPGFPKIIKIEKKVTFPIESAVPLLYLRLTVSFVTSLLLFAPLVVFALSLVCLVPIVLKLFRSVGPSEISAEWLENFSVCTYYPMEGLLSSEDFNFLSRQPGFDLSLYKKLRSDRLQIFRQYLHRMIADFNRLHFVARFILANNQEDHSELLKQLVWIKIRFSFSVARAEFSYLLCRVGVQTLPTRSLIRGMEEMSSRLNSIHATQAAELLVA